MHREYKSNTAFFVSLVLFVVCLFMFEVWIITYDQQRQTGPSREQVSTATVYTQFTCEQSARMMYLCEQSEILK